MNDNTTRDRKSAIFDKKRSIANYIKSEDDHSKAKNIKRLTGDNNLDLLTFIQEEKRKEKMAKEEINSNFPQPPKFSNENKIYPHSTNPKLLLSQSASVFNNFDSYKILEHELCLINLENYLAKFDEEEINDLKVRDLLSFSLEEFEKTRIKLDELLEISRKFYDEEMIDFLGEKIKTFEENKMKIIYLLVNLDKVEDFVILDETIKIFFKKLKR